MNNNDGDPLSALMRARPAFGASTEAEQLVRLTDRLLRTGEVEWLEVGAGDGRHLGLQLRRLSVGRSIRTIALEPAFAPPEPMPGVEWRALRIEDYRPDRALNWINMRHCGYYVANLPGEIARMAGSLADDGALVLTHWSRDCVLHRLHGAICGRDGGPSVSGIEDVADVLAHDAGLVVCEPELHDTTLLVDEVANSPAVALALFELVRRGQPPQTAAKDPATFVVGALGRMPNATVRRNGFLIVRRRSGQLIQPWTDSISLSRLPIAAPAAAAFAP